MRLTFNLDGTVEGLYSEAIDLHLLGPMSMRRASNIEFNEGTQLWEVRHAATNALLFHNASRNTCLDWEHDNL